MREQAENFGAEFLLVEVLTLKKAEEMKGRPAGKKEYIL